MGGLAKSMPYTRCDLPDRHRSRSSESRSSRASGRRTRSSARRSRTAAPSAGRSTSAGSSARSSPGSTRSGSTSASSTASPALLVTAHAARRAPRRGRALDAPPGRRARRRRDVHRLPRDPGRVGAVRDVARARRAAARAGDRRRGLADEPVRGRAAARSASSSPGGRSRPGASSCADGAVRTALEHKLWFDELYDVVFSRPAQLIAVRLRDRFEAPVVQGGLDEVADGTLRGASVTASAQTGLLRTYALAITVAVSVLTLVFLVVR